MMMKMGLLKKSLQKMQINIEQEIAIKRKKLHLFHVWWSCQQQIERKETLIDRYTQREISHSLLWSLLFFISTPPSSCNVREDVHHQCTPMRTYTGYNNVADHHEP
jgi:hypothetical protein